MTQNCEYICMVAFSFKGAVCKFAHQQLSLAVGTQMLGQLFFGF